jgi:UDP-N-acetylmuramate: L-alanyl-gamma-D-glutamyl-meso-diaminopimelate ligase
VVVNAWSEGAVAAGRDATAPLVLVGPHNDCHLRFLSWNAEGGRSTAAITWRGEPLRLELPQAGLHNLQNAAMAVTAAIITGIAPADAASAMGSFPGVARRMEVVGEAAGITVVDDFAHHPTALGVTIAAARQHWPDRRLVIAFEPRSLTAARRSFQDSYLENLSEADVVMVAPPFHRNRLESADMLDREALSVALAKRNVESLMPDEGEDAVKRLLEVLKPGDVVVGCSSGAFNGMHRKLVEALEGGDDS